MILDKLYNEWFTNPNWWFNNTDIDEYLKSTYYHLLKEVLKPSCKKEYIGMILLYDQLVRHFFRGNDEIILPYIDLAIHYSKYVINTYDDLQTNEFCFVFLPFRHSNKLDNIQYVAKETIKRLEYDNDPLLRQFFKATFQRYKFDSNLINLHEISKEYKWNIENFYDILEYAPDVLNKYGNHDETLINAIECLSLSDKYIISLSGGVDSMVCAYILKFLGYDFVAVHINYCNRSNLEETFVRTWCQNMEIPLYVRRITEIQREQCMRFGFRELYETYTKNVRYNCYKSVGGEYVNVILGHNKDDCLENILTNVCNNTKYENLLGMNKNSMIDGIHFIRTFLNIDKESIYKFARNVGIPYLHDSTPSWSQRGKIRDNIKPVLYEWNPLLVTNLFSLSQVLTDSNKIIDEVVNGYIKSTENNTLAIDIKLYYVTTVVFWEKYFRRMYPNYPISGKSLLNYIDKLKIGKPCRVILSKNISCTISYYTVSFHIGIM